MNELTIAIKVLLEGIQTQRDEILLAFIAKYGYEPDECEQVIVSDTDSVIRWYVRRRQVSLDEEETKNKD